jgi:hypothetical protein
MRNLLHQLDLLYYHYALSRLGCCHIINMNQNVMCMPMVSIVSQIEEHG